MIKLGNNMVTIDFGTVSNNRCCECRKGEHDDYDDDIKFVVVADPDRPNRFVCRGNVCSEHREAFESDGYTVRIIGTPTRIAPVRDHESAIVTESDHRSNDYD